MSSFNKVSRVAFMGTSEFSLAALKRLCESGFDVVAVYTRAPKPTGRGYKLTKTVVHQYAEERGIPVFTPQSLRGSEQEKIFDSLRADFTIVSSYGLIIPKNILEKSVFVNIHASLLPRWRGASPIQSAILAGDKETGISIMKMTEGLDMGDVISMKSIPITSEMTGGELSNILAQLGAEMILEFFKNPYELLKNSLKQSAIGVSYAAKISKDLCKIDWNESAEVILRKIKAFSPTPSAWTELNGVRIKILDASIPSDGEDLSKDFVAECDDGVLRLDRVQPSGKNPMSGRDFVRGHKAIRISRGGVAVLQKFSAESQDISRFQNTVFQNSESRDANADR